MRGRGFVRILLRKLNYSAPQSPSNLACRVLYAGWRGLTPLVETISWRSTIIHFTARAEEFVPDTQSMDTMGHWVTGSLICDCCNSGPRMLHPFRVIQGHVFWNQWKGFVHSCKLSPALGGTGCKLPEQSCLLPPASQVADRDTTSRI